MIIYLWLAHRARAHPTTHSWSNSATYWRYPGTVMYTSAFLKIIFTQQNIKPLHPQPNYKIKLLNCQQLWLQHSMSHHLEQRTPERVDPSHFQASVTNAFIQTFTFLAQTKMKAWVSRLCSSYRTTAGCTAVDFNPQSVPGVFGGRSRTKTLCPPAGGSSLAGWVSIGNNISDNSEEETIGITTKLWR